MFNWGSAGEVAEGVGNGVSTIASSLRHMVTGDLPPEQRIELEKLLHEAEVLEAKMLEGQVRMNVEEAKSNNIFKSGWRPAIGWIGVLALFYHFIGYNLLTWTLILNESAIKAPVLNSEGLFPLILGMLGIGGYRTYEKHRGITK